jgi:PAS domain S-box-containing protein
MEPRLLSVLADSVPLLVSYIDSDLKYRFNNKAYEIWFGLRRDELFGKHVLEVLGRRAFDQVRPYLDAVLLGRATCCQLELAYAFGGTRYVEATYTPDFLPDGSVAGFVAIISDITELKHVEQEQRFLKDATATLASSLDFRETLSKIAKLAVPVLADWCAVEIVGQDGRSEQLAVEHVEPEKVELAQDLRRRYPPRPTDPRGIASVLRTGEAELYETISDDMVAEIAYDSEHLDRLRRLGFKSAMLIPMLARGRSVGALLFVSAESGRHYTQHDLDIGQELAVRAALALDNARLFHEAQAAARAREDVLAVVSHDLRNPLAAIDLSAKVLLKRSLADDPMTRKHLDTILRASGRMLHMIRDLLDLASIQGGRLAIEKDGHDAEQLIEDAVELSEPMAAEKGIEVRHQHRVTGIQLHCDRDRILQVFANLLGNAIKFCRAGDVITVRATLQKDGVCIDVSDTGPGIPKEEVPHIFEPYWSGTRYAKKSTGLGLFITKGIIDAHGGRIWVESRLGAGTTFYFTLPVLRG